MSYGQRETRLQREKANSKINSERIRNFREMYNWPPIDITSPREIEQRLDDYFKYCEQKGLKPSIESVSLSLGITRQRFLNWRKRGGEISEICEKAVQMIAAILEDSGINGELNPAAYCFTMKNHFGYSDVTEVHTTNTETIQLPSKEEIIARLPGMDIIKLPEEDKTNVKDTDNIQS